MGASQALDPTGEVSEGGYWLLHSTDGGKTWQRPLYTGLRALQPYVVSTTSTLPLVVAGQVQLEVRVRELDPGTLLFPPIDLGTRREAAGLYVVASLADLERDTDGDGLTDLVEERLLTDPASADTDQDGLPDGADEFPNVPRGRAPPSSLALLRTEVLSEVLGGRRWGGNVVGTGATLLEQAGGRPAPVDFDATTFLIGSRADFVGVRSPRPVVVLTEEEVERLSRERGLLYPLRLDIVVNQAGTEAQVNWSEGWRGGSFDAHLEKGRWVLVSTGEWIT